jgi:TetR/AcrR family transcriptional repressor of nem operon
MGRTSDARQRLMDAAYSLICEYSYGAVTIEAICDRAAVKKGSFYYFFESKSDLAVAAIDAWWREREKIIATLFHADVAPVERLRRYLDFVAQIQLDVHARSGQLLGCPLFTLGAEICTQDERIRSRVLEFLGQMHRTFTGAIAEGQARGEIEPGDPETKARTLLSLYEGILTLARIENNPVRVRNLSHDALEAVGVLELAADGVPTH